MLSGGGVEARNGNACGGGVHRLIIASVTADDLRLTGMYIASVCYCFSPYNFPPIYILQFRSINSLYHETMHFVNYLALVLGDCSAVFSEAH